MKSGPRPPDNAPPGRGVLPPELLVEMRAPAARMLGADIGGLGMQLYGRSGPSDHVFGHDGIKYPAINHARSDRSGRAQWDRYSVEWKW